MILGLGIGVNTSIFSAVYSVLLKPLPYTQGDNLVVLRQPATKQGSDNVRFSPLEVGRLPPAKSQHGGCGRVPQHGLHAVRAERSASRAHGSRLGRILRAVRCEAAARAHLPPATIVPTPSPCWC